MIQIKIKISGITPKMPVKEFETKDCKMLFWSLIAVGFKTKKIPTLHNRMNNMYGTYLKIIEKTENIFLASIFGPQA